MSKLKNITLGKYRCILSDTLPYETPIIFSNIGLYNYLTTAQIRSFTDQLLGIGSKIGFTKPYNYNIKHKPTRDRLISIMHPSVQIRIADFYDQYSKIVLYLCSKSPLSLRAPSEVATKFHTKPFPSIDTANPDQLEDETASTYFVNKKYNFIYKFFTSYDFFNLEKKYLSYSTIDIQNCFPSIYTHSIAWAVKGKDFSKRNIHAKTFESIIDDIAQQSNYRETHGILVGSEFSRIFAEIILQRIDCNIVQILREEKIFLDVQYSIKRYVDDYFIFFNDIDVNKKVTTTIINELSQYKLFINEAKTSSFSRPFITNESIAKIKISEFMTSAFAIDGSFFNQKTSFPMLKQSIISKFKMITKECNVDLNKVCGFSLLKVLLNFSLIIQKCPQDHQFYNENLLKLIESTIDFSFFIFAMHPDNISSIRICKLITLVIQSTKHFTPQESEIIKYYVYTTFISTVKNFNIKENTPSVEILNILITFSHCDLLKFFGPSQLMMCFGIKNSGEDLLSSTPIDYFSLTTLIYLLRNLDSELALKIKNDIEHLIENFKVPVNFYESSESTMLFFDITACPYLDKSARMKFFKLHCAAMHTPPPQGDISRVFNIISAKSWFIEWSSQTDISVILTKKDIKTPY